MLPRPLDITIALKAINLLEDLSATDKRVAAALIDHFNHKTGQCDPGLERIAGLLGVHTRTVIRAIHRLVRLGLFRKYRHGGHLNRNQYEPVWSRFREIDAAWTVRFREKAAGRRSKEVSPAGRQTCHVGDGNSVTQTILSNQLKGTSSKSLPRKEIGERPSSLSSLINQICTRSADAARTEAERRWTNTLHVQFVHQPVTYGEIVHLIDAAMREAATDAEVRQRGAGIAHILRALRIPDTPTALGNPAKGGADDST
jgi:hypothetical protein